MVKTCCVKNCDIAPRGNVTCFRFPNNRFLKRKWIDAIGLSNKLTANSTVCIKHFQREDYDIVRGRPRLKAKVIPSVFCESDKHLLSSRRTHTEDDIISKEIDTEITLKSIQNDLKITRDTIDLTKTVTTELHKEKSADVNNESSTELRNERKTKLQKNGDADVQKVRKKLKKNVITLNADVRTESDNEDRTELQKKDTTESKNEGTTESKNEGTTESENEGTTESKNEGTTESKNEGTTESENENTTESKNESKPETKNECTAKSNNEVTQNDGIKESQNGDTTESQSMPSADVQNESEEELLNDKMQNEGSTKSEKEGSNQNNSENVVEGQKSNKSKPNGVILQKKHVKGYQDSFVESTKKRLGVGEDLKDIEDIIVNYQIKQTRPLPVDTIELDLHPDRDPHREGDRQEEGDGEGPLKESDPVFIEVAVQGGAGGTGDRDCLMVLESVQVELDPSAFLAAHEHELDDCHETVDLADEDDDDRRADPISLLTSSDEDEVILQEPHIDTVEVSDETDEDDVPLGKLLKRTRRKKPPPLWSAYEYFCTDCQYTAASEKEYTAHTAKHSTILQVCEVCDYTTASKSQFSRHKRKHKDDRKFKCHLCEYRARHNMSLIYHLKSHRALSSARRGFRCDKCGFKSDVKSAVLKHVKLCTSNVKKYSCDKCAYETKRPSDLRRHRARRHKEDQDDDEDFVP